MHKYISILLILVTTRVSAQVDTRVIETEQSRGNPTTEKVIQPPRRVDPPVRQEMPQPPRDVNRQLPLPMDQYWMTRRPSQDDCFNMPPQFRTICMDMGTSRNRSANFRPTNKPLRQQIQRATPQQRRQIQRAREEFKRKVRIILKK
jgi:hypothetical protein